MMTPQHEKETPQASKNEGRKDSRKYVAPRIITHSGSRIEKSSLTVNACTSFVP